MMIGVGHDSVAVAAVDLPELAVAESLAKVSVAVASVVVVYLTPVKGRHSGHDRLSVVVEVGFCLCY